MHRRVGAQLGRNVARDTAVELDNDGLLGRDAEDAHGNDEAAIERLARLAREHGEALLGRGGAERLALLAKRVLELLADLVERERLGC